LFDISSISSSRCWPWTGCCPMPEPIPASPGNRDYQPGSTAETMLKDLKLAWPSDGKFRGSNASGSVSCGALNDVRH
jgi:3-hydroxyisobutyrate dehydrogenase